MEKVFVARVRQKMCLKLPCFKLEGGIERTAADRSVIFPLAAMRASSCRDH